MRRTHVGEPEGQNSSPVQKTILAGETRNPGGIMPLYPGAFVGIRGNSETMVVGAHLFRPLGEMTFNP
jgi:hypothetical protein